MILLNNQKLDFEAFPNGETKVNGRQIEENIRAGTNTLVLKYETDQDLLRLMFVKRHIGSRFSRAKTDLFITYMPYSRMDRVEGQSVFTLKYVSEFINSLKFDRIRVVEPHSDVMMALLENVEAQYPTLYLLDDVMEEIGFNEKIDYLFFPDAGAAKRYDKIKGCKTAVGYKVRNFETGEIERLDIIGVKDLSESKVLIIDDLCSYGGTFDLSARKLRELGAREVHLLISHCENSIFSGNLTKPNSPIDRIFTTNSIISGPSRDGDRLKIFNII